MCIRDSSNRLMRSQKNRLIRAKLPSKRLLHAPKHASWNSNRLFTQFENSGFGRPGLSLIHI